VLTVIQLNILYFYAHIRLFNSATAATIRYNSKRTKTDYDTTVSKISSIFLGRGLALVAFSDHYLNPFSLLTTHTLMRSFPVVCPTTIVLGISCYSILHVLYLSDGNQGTCLKYTYSSCGHCWKCFQGQR